MRAVLPRVVLASGAALATSFALAGVALAQPARDAHAAAPGSPDALTRALEAGRLTPAGYALQRALALFDRGGVAARFGPVATPAPRAATLVLRDLVARLDELPPAERRLARSLLARPDEGVADPYGDSYTVPSRFECSGEICLHWVDTTDNAPPSDDADVDTIPDMVEAVQATLAEVWATEIDRYGYRPPLTDESSPNHGPDGRIDIYLVDVGSDGVYGYCTTDDPRRGRGPDTASAYCVLDNDFAPWQFGGAAAEDSLAATAAHEFFHAVQFAYDYLEDNWMMEATATWIEDEVFDDVDDNVGYLRRSQLSRPSVSLDVGPSSGTHPQFMYQYGAFLFYRYLSEWQGSPDIVRRVWELADAASGAPDHHSTDAIAAALEERGTTLRAAFRGFAAVNTRPAAFYEEGATYPVPSPSRSTALAAGGSARGRVELDHLTSWYGAFRPAPTLRDGIRLTVRVDGPRLARGTAATLVSIPVSGQPTYRTFRLDRRGDGVLTVPFDPGIASVTLVLSNASIRLDCWRNRPYACMGTPLDNDRVFRYRARVRGS